ncbi:MAG: flagellar biosynthesis protein FlhB [Clostridiales bacterium]|jgi:flagellar biosynthetic protein FlhB|nr:flagellar biosynthesis protein FlhB [Clostridiales bacterium]
MDAELRRGTLIPLSLSFFADEGGERTEKATPKKREKAREEGQVALSREATTAAMFIVVFAALRVMGAYMYVELARVFDYHFGIIANAEDSLNITALGGYFGYLLSRIALICAPLFAAAVAVGVVTNVIQVGWRPTTKPITPKFSKLNPVSGFKRMFSFRSLIELIKSLAKFGIIAIVIYVTLNKEKGMIFAVLDMGLAEAAAYVGGLACDLGVAVGAWYLIVAAADITYTRLKHAKDLRMTKQEVKEEWKQAEGNPQIKGQIKSKMREMSMRRMMFSVPHADVVITNPTRLAVALKYDRDSDKAPTVTAKGADLMAKRIREKAAECGVTIYEDKPLARTLYETVETGREIPPKLYKAVAEILAYVYKLRQEDKE